MHTNCAARFLLIQILRIHLKGAVSRDFWPLYFSWIEPIWAPDKQAKMVRLLFMKYKNGNKTSWHIASLKLHYSPHKICFIIFWKLKRLFSAFFDYQDNISSKCNPSVVQRRQKGFELCICLFNYLLIFNISLFLKYFSTRRGTLLIPSGYPLDPQRIPF